MSILKERVRLTLHQGAMLPDPGGLFDASLASHARRAIDLYEGDAFDEADVRSLVPAAVDHRLARAKTR